MLIMTDAQHVKFIWQLLALRKRMDGSLRFIKG